MTIGSKNVWGMYVPGEPVTTVEEWDKRIEQIQENIRELGANSTNSVYAYDFGRFQAVTGITQQRFDKAIEKILNGEESVYFD